VRPAAQRRCGRTTAESILLLRALDGLPVAIAPLLQGVHGVLLHVGQHRDRVGILVCCEVPHLPGLDGRDVG